MPTKLLIFTMLVMKGQIPLFCSGYSWYGWNPNDKQASISTTLHEFGKAVLEFGNCWKTGEVIAYKNNVEIYRADGFDAVKVKFDFQNGDELRITQNGHGIIQFSDLSFDSCSSKEPEYIKCDANSHANKLQGWKSKSAPTEWIFSELTAGPWDKRWTKRVSVSHTPDGLSCQFLSTIDIIYFVGLVVSLRYYFPLFLLIFFKFVNGTHQKITRLAIREVCVCTYNRTQYNVGSINITKPLPR